MDGGGPGRGEYLAGTWPCGSVAVQQRTTTAVSNKQIVVAVRPWRNARP
jgi:hypothetical protein